MNADNEVIYLGIDWGDSKVGLAIGSNLSKTAVPLRVVGSLAEVLEAISHEGIDEIVLGQPIKMSGQNYDLTPEFEAFAHALQESTKLPIHLVDERLTSQQADNLMVDKKTNAPQDAVAAMLILQTYLDQLY